MNKQEFISALQEGLAGLPRDDIEERITFYSEMIDDRIDDGISEQEAVAELGTVDDIVFNTMSEMPLAKLVKEKVKPGRALRAWEIVLLVLGSPIWLSLLIAAASVVIAVYIVLWSLIISLWAIEIAMAVSSLAFVAAFAAFIVNGRISGVAALGAGFICAGVAILGYFGCKLATKGILLLTKKICIWIKSCFIRKEVSK